MLYCAEVLCEVVIYRTPKMGHPSHPSENLYSPSISPEINMRCNAPEFMEVVSSCSVTS